MTKKIIFARLKVRSSDTEGFPMDIYPALLLDFVN
jgi:hypothetical protein